MALFSLAKTSKINITELPGGRYSAFVADEDGTVKLLKEYSTFGEASDAVQHMQNHLRNVRKKILGVESLVELRADYRAAKDRADALRDLFVQAKTKMAHSEYKKARDDLFF